MTTRESLREPLIKGNKTYADVTADIIRPVISKPGRLWFVGITISSLALLFGLICMFITIWYGIGTWGENKTIGWAMDITNFVWWVGIGHAGTFISAILLLFRQKWRTSINRAAEAMTIFAVICAALFPLIHLGRFLLFFFILPYPNTRNVWVNFNSPLLWDVFAITTYLLVSLLFWYMGLLPDIATVRDKVKSKFAKFSYWLLSFGWVGSAKHWQRHDILSLVLAGLATPLVLSVHTIVSFDFATSVIPGWHTTIFPPYFVSGAIFSGFAMVLTLMIVTRKTLHLEDYITLNHIESMNRIVILTGSIVGIAYITELFVSWYSGSEYEHYVFLNRATGPYAWAYWIMMTCNVITPQLYWFRKIRRNLIATFIISIFINIGMWFERFVIIVTSLHRDYLTSSWTMYKPTIIEIGILIGTLGIFFTGFFLFIKFFPVIAISEIKYILKDSSQHVAPKTGEQESFIIEAKKRSIMSITRKYIYGSFTEKEDMLQAVTKLNNEKVIIKDVLTPFPVHELNDLLIFKRSRIPLAGFLGGALGGSLAFLFQTWVFNIDYPVNVGGKPTFAVPAFVPVTFESTVLIAAFSMVFAFLFSSGIGFGANNLIYHPRVTDDRFVVVVNVSKMPEEEIRKLTGFFKNAGAEEVKVDEINKIKRTL